MRERLFFFLLILGFGILLARLFVLQIVQGAYWRQLAEGNRIRVEKIPALRGVVYDRDGEVLVRNTPEGREYIYGPSLAHVLGYVGEISQEELEGYKVAHNAFLESSPDLKGTRNRLSESSPRDTDEDEAHHAFSATSPRDSVGGTDNKVTGPIAKMSENGGFASSRYEPGDLIGKMGIEKEYDVFLRGQDGGILEEFDAQGEKVRELGKKEPVAGESLRLSLDLGLQKKAFELMEGKKGAIIASAPKTGEILALVSLPSFDSNIFTVNSEQLTVSSQKEIEEVLNDKNQPMFNRGISGLYPPGSAFKIVTAIAGLQEGKIDRETKIEDTGQIKVGKWTYANWYFRQYGGTEGMVDIVKAIKRSNDIFFYKVGEWLGIEKLSSWAGKFGFGELTRIDLPSEEKGLVPDKKWKKEVKGEEWYLGDDYITAIGQGDLLTTPLQVNMMTTVVANEGKWCKPYLVSSEQLAVNNQQCKDLEIEEENLKLVKEGMKQACLRGQKEGERNGTGFPFFDFGTGGPARRSLGEGGPATTSADFKRIEVACKTGTAESPGKEEEPHAWFTVFAPAKDPEIVLTVLVEQGGEGSSVAGPIAKEILEWWFERDIKN